MIDKRELLRLPPSERIKKLRLMEEERKEEVNEIEKLINESMRDLRANKLADEIAPEQRAVDISRLFETSGEQRLERTAREETPPAALMRGTRGYQAIVQTYKAYSEAIKLYSAVSMGGSLGEEEKKLVGDIIERVNTAERYMTDSEKVASKLDAARAVLYKLRKETGLG